MNENDFGASLILSINLEKSVKIVHFKNRTNLEWIEFDGTGTGTGTKWYWICKKFNWITANAKFGWAI